jgi:Flp pilus assembly pilin Flp
MKRHFVRLLADDHGQDLIEYALLTSLIGFSTVAAFDVIRTAIAFVYGTWNASANANWRPPDPAGGGS